MNSKTKDKLVEFINQVEILAQGVIHMTGQRDTETLIAAAEEFKNALEKDETIP
jgi:hypothetical protein